MPKSAVVIVAEDEMLIRLLAVAVLIDAGFEVIEAGHADHAISILEAQADDIHALFTDIHMPGTMDGLALAHHVKTQWPWIALLIASGQARPKPTEMPVGSRFLPKPYDPAQVVQHVRELTAVG